MIVPALAAQVGRRRAPSTPIDLLQEISIDLSPTPGMRGASHVRPHVFLCMLAYYLEWHMRRAWAPLLFEDHEKGAAQLQRRSAVARPSGRRQP
jgi:hypothetical protein